MNTRWKLNCGRAVTVLCAAAMRTGVCGGLVRARPRALEEVVVTATKRGETDVQKTAESIYAVGGADLTLKRETTFEAFAGSVPGLQFQNLGPGDSEYIIRGINGSGPSVVGAYLDEYVITASDQQDGGGKNAPIQLVDVERVEVLNGPQGTLYGSNSMAGNIRFITRKPDASKFDAYGEADWSSIEDGGDGYGISAVVNVPLVAPTNSRCGSSAIARTATAGSIRRASNAPRADRQRVQRPGRGHQLDGDHRRAPERALDAHATRSRSTRVRQAESGQRRLTALHEQRRARVSRSAAGDRFAPRQHRLRAAARASARSRPAAISSTPISPRARARTTSTCSARPRATTPASATSRSRSRNTSTISISRSTARPILLFFGVPIAGVTQQPQEYKTKMAELRFASDFDSPFNFVTGAYYQKDENEFNVHVVTTDGSGGPMPFNPLNSDDALLAGGDTFFGRTRADEVEQKAVFGEVTYKFAERWTLLGGLRWSDSDLQSIQATLHAFAPTGPAPVAGEQIGTTVNGNAVGLLKQDGSATLPKVSLSLQATDDVLLYALYSEGFRVGGINNGNQPFAPGIPDTFESDDLKNYEVGIKSRWLEDRLQLNATVFHIKWNDIQVEPRDPVGNIPFTTNGGAADVTGIEWSLDSLLTDQLSLTFTGTYFFEHELSERSAGAARRFAVRDHRPQGRRDPEHAGPAAVRSAALRGADRRPRRPRSRSMRPIAARRIPSSCRAVRSTSRSTRTRS